KATFDTLDESVKVSEFVSFVENQDFLALKSGKFEYKISKNKLPYKKIILMNSSLLGYFLELEAEDKIVAMSSPEYVFSEKIQKMITQNKIKNIGNDQKYDVEKIISIKPDAVFTNYIPNFENTYDLLKKNGIEIIFLDEYLEQKPLDKTKYLLVFGKLLGKELLAEQRFQKIATTYDSIKNITSKSTEKPQVLVNEIYGNQWYMSGGKTAVAHYLADAGAEYILKNNDESRAIPMSFEEVYAKSKNVKYWVNVGTHQTKKDLLNMNANYQKINVFSTENVYSTGARQKGMANDIFETGAVRADWVLKDYVKIFHPEILPNHHFIYMKPLR
ncbi:MAG: ABC transporter substrate-binding protein, partial [Bergeyella zoohelcum]|nr:ABC transporter substrate-binding protein [Bergeyella zoohelcum]